MSKSKKRNKKSTSVCPILNIKVTARDRARMNAKAEKHFEGNLSGWARIMSQFDPSPRQLKAIRAQLAVS